MGNCVTSGVVLIGNQAHRLQISSTMTRGKGRIVIHGLVDDSIEEPIQAAIAAADNVSELLEYPSAELSTHDLTFSITVPSAPDSPILGRSFHLALAVNTMFLLGRVQAPGDIIFTGEVNAEGDVLSVGEGSRKRAAAAVLGFRRILLPIGNFDFFEHRINQIPVRTIYEAWSALDA